MRKSAKRLLKSLRLISPAETARDWLNRRSAAGRLSHRHALHFHSQFIQAGDVVFDVGANVGDRTSLYLELGARIVSVEPQEYCLRRLKKRFSRNENVHIVGMALGSAPGNLELHTSEAHTLSSLSAEWIEATRDSGRFAEFEWVDKVTVPVTTLGNLIELYGVPSFCKIDVEGFEYQVLQGLSMPVPALSIEYVAEFIEGSISSVVHMARMADYRFNYTKGEESRLSLDEWVRSEQMCAQLEVLSSQGSWGNLYASLERR